MNARLSALFVERIEGSSAQGLVAAQRLLVVDACGTPHRVQEMLARLGSRVAVRIELTTPGQLHVEELCGHHDQVWLLLDAESDRGFCELLLADLRRCGVPAVVPVEVTADGVDELDVFPPSELGRCGPWRRSRSLEAGADRAAALLLEVGCS